MRIAPDLGALQGTLGAALYRSGDYSQAAAALEKSVGMEGGGYSADRFFLAMTSERLGHHDEAGRWYREGVMRRQEREPQSAETLRIQTEAAKLLGISQ